MPASSDRPTLIAALREVWTEMAELGTSLSPEQWDAATACPGWTVRDQFSHIIGTELMLLGRGEPPVDEEAGAHLANDIARMNEGAVARRRERTGADVLAEFIAVTHERLDQLAATTDADFDAESFTPAGPDTYGRFMQIRVFDCWIHEQDVREALGLPADRDGLAFSVTLDEHANAVGYLVGKRAGAAEGQSVRLELTEGPDDRARVIDVRVDGRARVVDDLDVATATVTVPARTWIRWAGGRVQPDTEHEDLVMVGDLDLARRVVERAAYTI